MQSYRSIFLSDMHLGYRGCQAALLFDFLHTVRTDHVFLLGDIVDMEAMRFRVHWPGMCTDVLKLLFQSARNGVRISYLPGNHDDGLQAFLHLLGASDLVHVSTHHLRHTLADGRKMLLAHGDAFEMDMATPAWIKSLGTSAYNMLLILNNWSNAIRHCLDKPYWSLSHFLRKKSRMARQHIQNYEITGAQAAKMHGMDGIICGHIHTPGIRHIDGVLYANCGDWIENCTALAETHQGELVLLDWKARTVVNAAIPLREMGYLSVAKAGG